MGMEKKILAALLAGKGGHGGRRLLVGVALAGVAGLVILVVLGVAAFKLVSGAMQAKPDAELLALEKLVREQAVVLDARQQEAVRPLLGKLAAPEMPPAEREALKQQLEAILTPAQAAKLAQWKRETEQKAAEVAGLPGALVAWLDQLGLPATEARQGIEALLAWLQLRTPGNSAEDLLRQLEADRKPGQ